MTNQHAWLLLPASLLISSPAFPRGDQKNTTQIGTRQPAASSIAKRRPVATPIARKRKAATATGTERPVTTPIGAKRRLAPRSTEVAPARRAAPPEAGLALPGPVRDASAGSGKKRPSQVGTKRQTTPRPTKEATVRKAGKGAPGRPAETAAAREAAPPESGLALPGAVREASADEVSLGEPVAYHNISIVPVLTERPGPFQRYALLEEGLEARTLEVRELAGSSDAAQVNAVEVRNTGTDPVYLLGGEMILGGKQDRIISRDTVIEKSRRWTRVPVFCVEQGRWRGQRMRFQSGDAIADLSLQKAAMGEGQSAVWREVSRKNVMHGTQSSTQTYRRTIQNARMRKRIAPYVRELRARMKGDGAIAGVVFGINGRIHVADIFGNPTLFDKLTDKLLSAYVLEALSHQVDPDAKPVSAKGARDFVGSARKTRAKKGSKSGRALNVGKENEVMIGTETIDTATEETVRETYISK